MTEHTGDSLRTWAEAMGTMQAVARAHGLRVSDIRLHDRHRKAVDARRAVASALDALGLTSVEIGMVLYRDHSTVLNLLGRTGMAKDRIPRAMKKHGRRITPWHARGYTKPAGARGRVAPWVTLASTPRPWPRRRGSK